LIKKDAWASVCKGLFGEGRGLIIHSVEFEKLAADFFDGKPVEEK